MITLKEYDFFISEIDDDSIRDKAEIIRNKIFGYDFSDEFHEIILREKPYTPKKEIRPMTLQEWNLKIQLETYEPSKRELIKLRDKFFPNQTDIPPIDVDDIVVNSSVSLKLKKQVAERMLQKVLTKAGKGWAIKKVTLKAIAPDMPYLITGWYNRIVYRMMNGNKNTIDAVHKLIDNK